MARDFGPFPTRPMYEVVNRRMQKAFERRTGFYALTTSGQGLVTADTGAQLVIAAYPDGAMIDGLYVENPASETVALTTNTASTNPRIDRLVMRLDVGAQTIAPFQIVGTPAASPQIPPLVQTATVFDMPLCRYTMPGSASAQNPGSIVDERPSIFYEPGEIIGRYDAPWSEAPGQYGATPQLITSFTTPNPGQAFYAEPFLAFEGGSSAAGTRWDFQFGRGGSGNSMPTNTDLSLLYVGEEASRYKATAGRPIGPLTGAQTWRLVSNRLYGGAAGVIAATKAMSVTLRAV